MACFFFSQNQHFNDKSLKQKKINDYVLLNEYSNLRSVRPYFSREQYSAQQVECTMEYQIKSSVFHIYLMKGYCKPLKFQDRFSPQKDCQIQPIWQNSFWNPCLKYLGISLSVCNRIIFKLFIRSVCYWIFYRSNTFEQIICQLQQIIEM